MRVAAESPNSRMEVKIRFLRVWRAWVTGVRSGSRVYSSRSLHTPPFPECGKVWGRNALGPMLRLVKPGKLSQAATKPYCFWLLWILTGASEVSSDKTLFF